MNDALSFPMTKRDTWAFSYFFSPDSTEKNRAFAGSRYRVLSRYWKVFGSILGGFRLRLLWSITTSLLARYHSNG